jgi:hypothetical protein
MSKMNFIIWSYLDGLIRVEETNILLKTYTHRREERSDEAIYSIAYLAHLSLRAFCGAEGSQYSFLNKTFF